MRTSSIWGAAAVAALSFAALAACDDRLATQPARDHRSVEQATTGVPDATPERAPRRAAGADRRASDADSRPVRLVKGRPMWSENRSHTAEENAQYQFEHHGAELGARDLDDFLVRVHQFVNSPPEGVLSQTRANGDRLLFDPRSKLFGVVRSDGAPRTVFKPEDGQAYWEQQVAGERGGRGQQAERRSTRRDRSEDRS